MFYEITPRYGIGAQMPNGTTTAVYAAFVLWVPLVASPKKHENWFCTHSS